MINEDLVMTALQQHTETLMTMTASLHALLERVDQLSHRLETVERSQTHVLHALVEPGPDQPAR